MKNPPNTLVFALSEPNAIEAIKELDKNKIIHICEWLGSDKGQGVITYDYGTLLNYETQSEISVPCPSEIYDRVYNNIYRFIDFVTRMGNVPTYEYVQRFNMYLNFYYGLFTKHKINLLIFGDNPHFGVDSMAKDLADAMGIKTILFQQALEPNRFFALTEIEDVGVYNTLPNHDAFESEIEEKFEKDLHYMKNITVINPTKGTGERRILIGETIKKVWKHRHDLQYKCKKAFFGRVENWAFHRKVDLVYERDSQNMIYHQPLDLDCKYVYFPLHLQPEMTTSSLGGKFCDQILAIERLRELLPESWKIYVKENPKQSYYMRDELFFRRLRLIPNICFVSRNVNTYDLIAHAQFVATITGTVGWEAISGGRCVLVFGLAWYRKLPGVFEYTPDMDIQKITQYKIDHKELTNAYNEMMGKSYVGILECGSEKNVKNYSDKENNQLLYKALSSIIPQAMKKA